jgi:hypothetical protein
MRSSRGISGWHYPEGHAGWKRGSRTVAPGFVIADIPWGLQACVAVYFLVMLALLALAVAALVSHVGEIRGRTAGGAGVAVRLAGQRGRRPLPGARGSPRAPCVRASAGFPPPTAGYLSPRVTARC